MEDALDIFLVHVEPDNGQQSQTQSMLKRALKMFRDLFSKYRIDDSLVKPAVAMASEAVAAMYREASQLIGIDKSRGQVVSMLYARSLEETGGSGHVKVPDDKTMKIVSVVGVGGLGKTTLAKAVHEELRGHFRFGAFVPVGRNPDLKRVFKDILLDLDKKKYKNLNITILDERHLIDEIRGFLKGKRYFIVIDDIWEKQSWEIIKLVLVEDNCGSRIITTTRNSQVAKETGDIYKLQPLSHDHSRKLFYTRIFGAEGKCHGVQADEVSDKILKKCDGVPLAIITMASLLVGKPREVWSELYSDIGFGQHKDNPDVENTMRILSFSYYDLPSHLRTCLLYLSAFPEDYVIEKKPLIWKWIAEGFVCKKQGNGLFEVGEQYFNELIKRSMIQAVESEHYGMIEGCRVHDMVVDLIRSLSCHENSVTLLDNTNAERISSQNRVRRLACQKYDLKHLIQAEDMDMSSVRSCIAFMCRIDQCVLLLSFKLLRVLAIRYCKFKDGCHIENLGNLLQLRYLSLRNTNVSELPEQIGNLKFLQTLDLYCTEIKELPASIAQLSQLLCLSCDFWGINRVPKGIGKLTSLEELTIRHYEFKDKYNNERMFLKELGSLRELRVLEVEIFFKDRSMQRCLVESLRNLHKIEIKVIPHDLIASADIATWEPTASMQHLCRLSLEGFQFFRLPPWISHLHHLSYLSLRVFTMDEQDLKLFGSLAELCYVNLGDTTATVTVSKIKASDIFFQKLKCFVMRRAMVQFQHLEDSTFSFHIWNGIDPMPFGSRSRNNCCVASVVMPNLQVLNTSVFVRALKDNNGDCSNIGLEHLTSLQKVKAFVQCQGTSDAEVEIAEAKLQDECFRHPNRPKIQMHRRPEDQELEEDISLPSEEEDEDKEGDRNNDNHNKDGEDTSMRMKKRRRRIEE
ncbi:unnamed protein product [Urochloa decumbens]|uniref:NB-ARC domain-containing protein n=1 Tax=Urochloa decumbens TaxID=240449 RepID=A0ABC9DVT4_9POAL